jgi:hypothetical protein
MRLATNAPTLALSTSELGSKCVTVYTSFATAQLRGFDPGGPKIVDPRDQPRSELLAAIVTLMSRFAEPFGHVVHQAQECHRVRPAVVVAHACAATALVIATRFT